MSDTSMSAFKKQASIWLPITAVLAILGSSLYLLLFRRYAKLMVMATIVGSVGFGVLFSIVCFATGAVPFGIILLIMTALTALFYWWIRGQLRMCADLLAIAGRGLTENLGLVPAALGIKLAGLCVLVYGAAGFFAALNIGHAGPSMSVVSYVDEGVEQRVCLDAALNQVSCCAFYTKGWAGAYAFFAWCFVAWSAMLIMQIKLYTVADTMAQWYFSAASGANSSAAVGSAAQTAGSVKLALKHCLTSSFGSVAFAAAILALIRMLRRAMERAARNNVICCILNCVMQPLLALAEKFTRFATIACAITGQPFVPAAKAVFDTLKRNFLQTYSLWWVPDTVLQFAVTLMSLTWAGIVFFASYGAAKGGLGQDAWGMAFGVAFCAFGIMFYTLLFVAGLLLDVVNTLYICFALDKDQRRVTHPEIHAIYNQVPGLAVQQPDGNIVYGAPEPHHAPSPAQPPAYPSYPPAGGYAAPGGYATATYPAPGAYPGGPYPGGGAADYASSYPAAYPPAPVVQPPPQPIGGYGAVPSKDQI
ncbi:hypothetical protein CHLRE_14g617800v5 [Chlamydomonas reinhardtii]|uniref:Choline transporter-like protein n=1 Tax=Chlamydomonas reinhardtii TaxID=3055 RepID=A0A2K3CXR4_CHLRE|nr:uncharacterized protein CHLRE_14g617800v5 [Chlamydomonas reinhardtii]PNW73072.1 hypothetical protein CHLRE_14g617800v5 [Chlamydomonas reinhardtii]